MKDQLNYDCEQHPKLCPDVAVTYSKGKYYLISPNAEYSCYYCPSCGEKL